MSWKKLSSKTLFVHPRITLVEDSVILPAGQEVTYLTFGEMPDSACVICLKDDMVLLQKEYSYPPNEELYQFPGGKVEPNETTAEGALRELAEEAGLKPGAIEKIGWFYVDNRRTDARQHVYVARDCSDTPKVGGDQEEHITSHWVPISRVDAMIKDGSIVNYSLLAAWSIFKAA